MVIDQDTINDLLKLKKMVALGLLNRILKLYNKPQICGLEEFKDIDREYLITKECLLACESYESVLFTVFLKGKSGWHRRNNIKWYTMTLLRHIMNDVGMKFIYKKKEVVQNLEGKIHRKTHLLYSVAN